MWVLLIAGGFKGYGLAMMVEVVCGILADAAFGPNVRKWKGDDRVANLVSTGAFSTFTTYVCLVKRQMTNDMTNDMTNVFIYYQGKVFERVLDFTSKDGFNAS